MIRDIMRKICEMGVNSITLEHGALNLQGYLVQFHKDSDYDYEEDFLHFRLSDNSQLWIHNINIYDYEFDDKKNLTITLNEW